MALHQRAPQFGGLGGFFSSAVINPIESAIGAPGGPGPGSPHPPAPAPAPAPSPAPQPSPVAGPPQRQPQPTSQPHHSKPAPAPKKTAKPKTSKPAPAPAPTTTPVLTTIPPTTTSSPSPTLTTSTSSTPVTTSKTRETHTTSTRTSSTSSISTTSSTNTPTAVASTSNSGGLSGPAIGGLVVAIICVFVAVSAGLWLWMLRRRCRKSREHHAHGSPFEKGLPLAPAGHELKQNTTFSSDDSEPSSIDKGLPSRPDTSSSSKAFGPDSDRYRWDYNPAFTGGASGRQSMTLPLRPPSIAELPASRLSRLPHQMGGYATQLPPRLDNASQPAPAPAPRRDAYGAERSVAVVTGGPANTSSSSGAAGKIHKIPRKKAPVSSQASSSRVSLDGPTYELEGSPTGGSGMSKNF